MQRRFLAKHGPTCRGARAPEELRRRMQRSAVKIQAAFRGHRTRVRFKYLMMLQDQASFWVRRPGGYGAVPKFFW